MSASHPFVPPSSSASVVDLREVTRKFGDRTVLDQITLEVRRGEIFGLLGPSGSGKTTLIKLITGIDQADGGIVHMLGEKMPKLAMLQRFGYMAQSDALYNELTARENLQFFASLYSLAGARRNERIQAVMGVVDLLDHLNKPVSAYSGGMKRRLSLAISLLHEPEVLILDEPTVGIDPVLRQSIWKELLTLRDQGTTIILTTHVMDEADKCDRIGLIRDGHLTAVDSPDALKTKTGTTTIEDAFIVLGGGIQA
ncbi:ABC transporter ATP-binding protein [Paenibacillus selenitireducens]|jgi:ABC-2 type transport system ATP-binding protein|uniref:ABC transporter ATP-binding protein n=1 Tax=Paenibacillus selenitireducens TaxID=1324314 RepID=A0A1T2X307_9BACL|nr:ABC transporter ATP-binding protein [Paenibacillus selenitireducens]OPA73963.1 ABC transporter ATP-binding protein [Paenibacillus selenitireducens]